MIVAAWFLTIPARASIIRGFSPIARDTPNLGRIANIAGIAARHGDSWRQAEPLPPL
ncbi:hypothetical protein BSIN_0120 [Burkholderia singularis]|uniref:Uncharacterized protein n=1 Tax=Burkholderia singularis TaxID=1503053 RepID=A0A238H2L9_9BURK|nr:hypothetical protein BSIN_0120 [Burkholderia singularis]